MSDTRPIPLRDSIVFKLLKVIFAIYCIVTITVTIIHIIAEYQHSKDRLHTHLNTLESLFKPSLSTALWNLDYPQMETLLQGLVDSPSIQAVQLTYREDKSIHQTSAIFQKGDIPANHHTHHLSEENWPAFLHWDDFVSTLFTHDFELNYSGIEGQDWTIGHITLYTSRDIIMHDVKTSLSYIVIGALVKTLALWLCFIWAGRLYLSKPLLKLTQAVSNLNLRKLKHSKIDANISGQNELKLLENTFNQMVQTLNNEIEQRRTLQRRHQNAKHFLDDIINSMPYTLIGIDDNLCITHWNQHAAMAKQTPEHIAIGQPLEDIYPELAKYILGIKKTLSERTPQRTENLILSSEGKQQHIDLTLYPLTSEEAKGAVIIIEDITQKVQMEQMVIHSEKMASIAGLGAGMAHEINNPLGIILQSVQNIQRRLSPNQAHNLSLANQHKIDLDKVHQYLVDRKIVQFLDGIKDAGERASRIIANMLSFSRTGSSVIQDIDIHELLNRVVELLSKDRHLKNQVRFKSIRIVKDFDQKLPLVPCEPTQLEQVFFNIIKNAAQALIINTESPTKPKIVLKTRTHKGRAQIMIADNGPGMDASLQKRIFEPFYTTKRPGEGTGLGLYVSYFIITQKHKGSIRVESAPHSGTEFIIELPLQQIQNDTCNTT